MLLVERDRFEVNSVFTSWFCVDNWLFHLPGKPHRLLFNYSAIKRGIHQLKNKFIIAEIAETELLLAVRLLAQQRESSAPKQLLYNPKKLGTQTACVPR